MVQSPSWEADSHSGSQYISRILWNMKVHYRVQKCPLLNSILNQFDRVQRALSYLLKTYFNIVLHLPLYLQCSLFLSDIPAICSLLPSISGGRPLHQQPEYAECCGNEGLPQHRFQKYLKIIFVKFGTPGDYNMVLSHYNRNNAVRFLLISLLKVLLKYSTIRNI
jgi:hypothetical protein